MLWRLKLVLLSSLVAGSMSGAASAFDPVDSSALVREITSEKIMNRLETFQAIAARNDNVRALGTEGYKDSVGFVSKRLIESGYDVHLQAFTARLFEENSPPVLVRTEPTTERYRENRDFLTMTYSGARDVTAPLALARGIRIPPSNTTSSTSGCEADDFPANVAGKIVLIQRGTCTFFDKANNARKAGAVGVIIFNEGQEGRQEALNGTLGEELRLPVVGASFEVGEELYNIVERGRRVQIHLAVDSVTTPKDTYNVIAEKAGRREGRTVVVGAHLDSVEEGPGINDNGSGSAAVLVIAQEFAKLGIQPRNTLRFAFWGAEEQGLFGSTHYVNTLTPSELGNIAVNLNFDMLGSPNFVRFVYDGDGSNGPAGPPGSDVVEQVFVDYFRSRGLRSAPTAFDGRSDYFPFINVGIPAGGLFSGAEEVKTENQERIYGGRAGAPYDKCYHERCDDISNVNRRALSQLGKAAAHAVFTFAMTAEDVRQASERAVAGAASAADYRGNELIR